MAKPIIIANWKNFPNSLPEARDLLKEYSKKKALYSKTAFFVAPPAPYLELVSKSFAKLGSQDLVSDGKGAHTGAVSVETLKSFGVKLAIIGHSERRALGETSAEVALKVKAALKASITPVVCVGELSRDGDGEHFSFLQEEIKSSLVGLNKKDLKKVIIAYEPIWAIGKSSKDAIKPEDLSQTIIFIKKVLSDLFGRTAAEETPIIYGGSVEPGDAQILVDTGVAGFLVGHAALSAKNLQGIVETIFQKE